ncbi:hypothetical protein [Zobellia laminariae]|uniref:hypothetical protein n=1 Tax=Zobellia laminariae TaxID=248906 RepID=UPI0026F4698A|nr:hypothetical protein [Zobellia laminariae]WKX75826.1 hypothetical protein Q5W13_19855 [Zobellia laminariae]
MANELINTQKIRAEIEAMIEMISHPAFVEAVKTMKKKPISKRRQLGKKILSIDHLRSKGVMVPKGMRVTIRYFESGRPGIIELLPDGKIRNTKYPRFLIGDKLNPVRLHGVHVFVAGQGRFVLERGVVNKSSCNI